MEMQPFIYFESIREIKKDAEYRQFKTNYSFSLEIEKDSSSNLCKPKLVITKKTKLKQVITK